jgi:hypothetical protein
MATKVSKKIASKSVVSQSASTAPVAVATQDASQDPGAPVPATILAPQTPTDWAPAKIGRGKGARGKAAQASNAAVAGNEIGSSATYAADFGPHAPSQARLAHLLVGAAGWRGQWVSSKRFTAYAAEQNANWWEAALEGADLFQPAFDYAVARDPSIVQKYPSTTQFMQAASAIGKRAATVRKAKAKGANGGSAKGKAAASPAAETPGGTGETTAETAAVAPVNGGTVAK